MKRTNLGKKSVRPSKLSSKNPAKPRTGQRAIGVFEARSDGSGRVRLDGSAQKVEIPMGRTLGALSGDRVSVVFGPSFDGRRSGRRGQADPHAFVEQLIDAGPRILVGTLLAGQSVRVLVPDGKRALGPVLVDGVDRQVPSGIKAVVSMAGPDSRSGARPTTAQLVRVLGDERDPKVLIESARIRYGLDVEFDEAVIRQAMAAATAPVEDAERLNLSEVCVLTIDPADAKDFDDAVSLAPLPDGTMELGVHIADVASYVPEGSAIDVEARRRGTSVYLPGQVLPMLPEALSSGACSLRQAEPRRTLSVFMTFDSSGTRTGQRFARTLICSHQRLTYEQAQAAIDAKVGDLPPEVVTGLAQMAGLAKSLIERRTAQGMLNLDLPEIELVLGPDGGVSDARPKPTLLAHRLIEMFMVEANEAVAERLHAAGVASLRRIHEPPSESHLDALSRLARALGHTVPEEPTRSDLVDLLKRVSSTPSSFALSYAVLRALSQARYSPAIEGHYALASRHYCHFTSPIRRYPDLVVHRALTNLLIGQKPGTEELEGLDDLAAQCSASERRAAEVEREVRTSLVLLHLTPRIGEEFEGVITAVTDRGMFVQWPRYLIDGMIRYEDLGGQWWEPSPLYGMVRGEVTGEVLRVGDKITVKLAAVWPSDGRMDLRPVAPTAGRKVNAEPKPREKPRPGRTQAAKTAPAARRRSPTKRRSSK